MYPRRTGYRTDINRHDQCKPSDNRCTSTTLTLNPHNDKVQCQDVNDTLHTTTHVIRISQAVQAVRRLRRIYSGIHTTLESSSRSFINPTGPSSLAPSSPTPSIDHGHQEVDYLLLLRGVRRLGIWL